MRAVLSDAAPDDAVPGSDAVAMRATLSATADTHQRRIGCSGRAQSPVPSSERDATSIASSMSTAPEALAARHGRLSVSDAADPALVRVGGRG